MVQDFLLKSKTAKTLYHDHAEAVPIIDYHCHIKPMEIYQDKRYDTITGDAAPAEKFQKWAETIPNLIGNPLYHWTHLDLQCYFGITEPLNGDNAMGVYEKCNAILAQPDMSVRGIIRKSNQGRLQHAHCLRGGEAGMEQWLRPHPEVETCEKHITEAPLRFVQPYSICLW